MLSSLSRTASRLLDLHWNEHSNYGDCISPEEDDILSLHLQTLSQLSLSLPENTVENVAGFCGRLITPLHEYVGSTLSADVETLVQTLHESDPSVAHRHNIFDEDDEPIYLSASYPIHEHEHDFSNVATELDGNLTFSTASLTQNAQDATSETTPDDFTTTKTTLSHPIYDNIPTIIVTLASPRPRERSSLVPLQNANFGAHLTVPTHMPFNVTFPPMAVSSPSSVVAPSISAAVHVWTYENGHWHAEVPSVSEQDRIDVFSRPFGLRRRSIACSRRKQRIVHDPSPFIRPFRVS